MDCCHILPKVSLLFQKISEPGYIMDNYYADSFITKLSDNSSPDASSLINGPVLLDFLLEAFNDTKTYHNTVKVFFTRTLAVVCKVESHFSKTLCRKFEQFREFLNDIDAPNISPSLQVAYMEVAMALASHGTGICWLLDTDYWKKIFNLKTESVTVFVVRLKYKFTSDFLWRLDEACDMPNLDTVLKYLWEPIENLNFSNKEILTMNQINEEEICKVVEPVLEMMLSITSRKDKSRQKSIMMTIIMEKHNFVTKVCDLYDKFRSEQMILRVSKLLFHLVLIRVFQSNPVSPDVVYTDEDFTEIKVLFLNTVQNLVKKRNISLILDYCFLFNSVWSTIVRDKNPSIDNGNRNMKLESQVIFMSLIPCFVYIRYRKPQYSNDGKCEYDIDVFAPNVPTLCENMTRMAYAFRDLNNEADIISVTLQTVKRFTSLKGVLNNDQANVVFQALFLVLGTFDPCFETKQPALEDNLEVYERTVQIMTHAMDTILLLVKNYNINWQESIQVVCLNSLLHRILTRKNLTCKFVVASLNVIIVTVQKFLAPNLLLLMESKPGSSMHEIGTLIFTRIHDMNWEVRDTALELLLVCTEIAHIKFPSIQERLLEHNLINVALTIALNDHEPYVQVTAFRCVGAAVKVPAMWELMKTENPQLQDDLLVVLQNNSEGIVRREVCNVFREIYQHKILSPTFKQTLYDHMASTAISDFHWEVQISALKFWKVVINSFLSDQGMLDGTFPPVTFSRESRKIVTLNDTEIQRRMQRVLDDLADVGCLTVLIKLINDDHELDVMEAALELSEELFTILDKYKVVELFNHKDGDPTSINELIADTTESQETDDDDQAEPESTNKSENVIDGILKSDDINLLSVLYKTHMNLQKENPNTPATLKIKVLRKATSYLFVKFMKGNNFKTILEEKRNWKEGIRSVSSLLDDVLGLYEVNEMNSLDCY